MINEFATWLASTRANDVVQNTSWIIPVVQSVHILCIAIVVTSVAMLDLRLLGIAGRRQSLADTGRRFLPWIWCALVLLALTGSVLIIGEPARELQSDIFWLKMTLVACAIALTAVFNVVLNQGATFWERNRVIAVLTGVVSLGLWLSILAAGRWIAYGAHG